MKSVIIYDHYQILKISFFAIIWPKVPLSFPAEKRECGIFGPGMTKNWPVHSSCKLTPEPKASFFLPRCVIYYLQKIVDENPDEKPTTRAEVRGIYNNLNKVESCFAALVWHDIMDRFDSLGEAQRSGSRIRLKLWHRFLDIEI